MSDMKSLEFIFFLAALVFYVRHLFISKFTPHPLAFAIWLTADVINFFTYTDFSKFWIGPALMPLGAGTVVIIAIIRRKQAERKPFKLADWICVGIAVASLLVWAITRNAIWANMFVQVLLVLGFVPIIGNILANKPEPLLPWFFFILGFTVTCVDTLMGYENRLELVYPIANLFCSLLVFVGSWSISPEEAS